MDLNTRYWCKFCDIDNSVVLYKLFVIKLEDKPWAYYWKEIEHFNNDHDLSTYCKDNNIENVKQNNFIFPNSIFYLN